MTTQEFSNEFDVLLNSYSQVAIPGEQFSKNDIVLDEYEKSVLLTQAQEEVVRGLYNGNLTGKSFEETEELRRSLSSSIKTVVLQPIPTSDKVLTTSSKLFQLPEDVWFITYEHVTVGRVTGDIVKVIPMRQDEWHKVKDNPFRKPTDRKVIRLDYGANTVELISNGALLTDYLVKYLSKPSPIILVSLPEDLSINGEQDITECQLNTALHRIILERAVQLAYKRFPQASK